MKANYMLCNKVRFFALPIYQRVTINKELSPHYNPSFTRGFAENDINTAVFQ